MTEQVALIPKENESVVNGTLLQLLEKKVPILAKARAGATAAMAEITVVDTDEDIEKATDLLVAVRSTYEKMTPLRKELTDPLDQLKDFLMDFERPLNPDMKSNSDFVRIKKLVGAAEQRKIERNKKLEEEARLKKLKDQAVIDAKASIKLNVADMIVDRCKKLQTGLEDFFDSKNVADQKALDDKIKQFEGTKWRLKQEDYDKCFVFPKSQYMLAQEVTDLVKTMREELPFDNVNAMLMEKVTPIVNVWKSKLPQIREQFKAIFSEKDEEKRKKLEEEKRIKDQEEANRAAESLKEQERSMQADVMSEQTVNKVEADFTEQATVQGLEKTAPKKKVIKFKNDKPAAEIAKMLYHIFMSPKFKGIYKMKNGEKVLDDRGRPVYIDAIEWIADEFASKCDAEIENTIVYEDAKTIIRK